MADEVKDVTAGGETQEVTQPEQPEVPAFDPSTVDLSDADQLANLSDEQLRQVEQHNPAAPPAKADTGETSVADPAAKADASAQYAGKYPTADDLVKGVSELAGKLGYKMDLFQPFIDAAKAAGKFETVEALYKKLEQEQGERGAAPAAQPTKPDAVPDKDTTTSDTFNPADPKVAAAVDQLTLTQLSRSTLVAEMNQQGIAMPRNMDEFEGLKVSSPYYAVQFANVYRELYQANVNDAKGYFEASKTVESANTGVVTTDTQAIKDFAAKEGLTVTDADLAQVKAAALANPANFETRFGHKFLRSDAVKNQFFVSVLPQKLAELKLAQKAQGRTEAVADLQRHAGKEVKSLGTSNMTTKTRAIPKMPDLNDPEVVASLPDAALADPEAYFKSFRK